MNYEEARQFENGKWNWTNYNDSVNRDYAYVIWPCRDPAPDKKRCDHDTREEAERHHWEWEIEHTRIEPWDEESASDRLRCRVKGCPAWQTRTAFWPDGFRAEPLCDEHGPADVWPFEPGMRSIHS